MAGHTKEQRAAKAEAGKVEARPDPMAEDDSPDVLMERDGKTTEVRKGPSVAIMQALGWNVKDQS